MLDCLQVVDKLEITALALPMAGIGSIQTFSFPHKGPWQLVYINALRRNGASTLIDGVLINDPTGVQVFSIGFVPWLGAGITENTSVTHTPQISQVSFFGNNISNFISNDFNVFNNWQWQYNTIIASAGGTTDITFGFVQNG